MSPEIFLVACAAGNGNAGTSSFDVFWSLYGCNHGNQRNSIVHQRHNQHLSYMRVLWFR